MSTTELLPCPFCGSTQIYETFESDSYYGNTEDTAVLFCNACKATVKLEQNESEGVNEDTRRIAREAWNTRAERTCELDGTISFEWQATSTTFYTHSLSCGHDVTTTEPEPPNYCEECGAKAVER